MDLQRCKQEELIETFKIVNGKYSINSEFLLNTTKVEEEDTQRNYLKRGPDWMLTKKISFSNRVVDKWNSLTDTCVNCITVNNFKDYILKELEPKTCTIEYYCLRVGIIGVSLCLLTPSVSSDIDGFGECSNM